MTDEQKNWLSEHPKYSRVRESGGISWKGWTDRGYLFANGSFIPDDGQTLFPHKYPAWFATRGPSPMHVGREHDIV